MYTIYTSIQVSCSDRASLCRDYQTLPCTHDLSMTRVTDFGRKRAHVEATFNYNEADLDVVTSTQGVEIAGDVPGADGQPPKKKRKRGPRKKAGTDVAAGAGDDGESGEKGEVEGEGEGKNVNGGGGKKRKAKSRTLQGSFLLIISLRSQKFIPTPPQNAKKFRKSGVGGEWLSETRIPSVLPVERRDTPSRIVPRSPTDPSNHQKCKAVSVHPKS